MTATGQRPTMRMRLPPKPGPVALNGLEYWIKTETMLGGRNGTDRTATIVIEQNVTGLENQTSVGTDGAAEEIDNTELNIEFDVATFKPDESRVHGTEGNLTWVELMTSKIPDITSRKIYTDNAANKADDSKTTETEIEAEIAALITAYNKGESTKTLLVAVNVALSPAANDEGAGRVDATGAVTVTVSRNPQDADTSNQVDDEIDSDTVCVGLVKEAHRDPPHRHHQCPCY